LASSITKLLKIINSDFQQGQIIINLLTLVRIMMCKGELKKFLLMMLLGHNLFACK